MCQHQCGMKTGLGGCFGLNLRVGCGSGFQRPTIFKDFFCFFSAINVVMFIFDVFALFYTEI
jgi:hypothetical protein